MRRDIDAVHLHVPPIPRSTIQLLNLEGKLIQTIKVERELEVLDIRKLVKGTYILSYSDGIHFDTIQFVKVDWLFITFALTLINQE